MIQKQITIIALLFIFIGIFQTTSAQVKKKRFKGKPVVVVKSRKALRPVKRSVIKAQTRVLNRLPATSKTVVYRNQRFHIVDGYYYRNSNGVYKRVQPPVGARLVTLPVKAIFLTTNNRRIAYASGVYYQQNKDDFAIIAPPVGATIDTLPEETETVKVDDQIFYQFEGALYQSIETVDGISYKVVGLIDKEDIE